MFEGLPGARISSLGAGVVVEASGGSNAGVVGIVLTGAVLVSIACRSVRSAARSAVALLGPDDGYGLEAVTTAGLTGPEPPLHRHLRGLVASRVLQVPAPSVCSAIAERPAIAAALLELLADQTERTERRLIRTVTLPMADRLLAELRELANVFGRPVPGGRRIELPLTQDLLADLIGGVRESVNRAVRTLTARGSLVRTGSSYVVRDVPEP